MTIKLDNAVTIEVVASNGHVRNSSSNYPLPENYKPRKENSYSIALLMSYFNFEYLIAGDLTKNVENKLKEDTDLGDLDVYHVNHHGSDTSSALNFLKRIKPEVAIISNGDNAKFNHPRNSVLERIKKVTDVNTDPDISIYQTNELTKLINSTSGKNVGGNVPQDFIANITPNDTNGNIVIIVNGTTGHYRCDHGQSPRTKRDYDYLL